MAMTKRTRTIVGAVRDGCRKSDVAREHGISRQAVDNILARHVAARAELVEEGVVLLSKTGRKVTTIPIRGVVYAR